jgi:hypothetical protein
MMSQAVQELRALGLARPGSCLAMHYSHQRGFNSSLGSNDSRHGDDYSYPGSDYSRLGRVDSCYFCLPDENYAVI